MKEYKKPEINEEVIEIEDIIAVSGGDGVADENSVQIKDVMDIFK